MCPQVVAASRKYFVDIRCVATVVQISVSYAGQPVGQCPHILRQSGTSEPAFSAYRHKPPRPVTQQPCDSQKQPQPDQYTKVFELNMAGGVLSVEAASKDVAKPVPQLPAVTATDDTNQRVQSCKKNDWACLF